MLALLPFEPAAYVRLDGPHCTYVGHPLIERLEELKPSAEDSAARGARPPMLLLLPGSRRCEIRRLMPIFGKALTRIVIDFGSVDAVLPAVPHLEEEIRWAVEKWMIRPRIITGEAAKWAAFRRARASLAASGTVTLELALAGVPMSVAYKVSILEEQAKYFIHVPSIVLPNLILGENVVPEFLQRDCTAENLARSVMSLLRESGGRTRQIEAFARLDGLMRLEGGESPSARAARIILELVRKSSSPH